MNKLYFLIVQCFCLVALTSAGMASKRPLSAIDEDSVQLTQNVPQLFIEKNNEIVPQNVNSQNNVPQPMEYLSKVISNEIAWKILSFLRKEVDRTNISTTCKLWKEVFDASYTSTPYLYYNPFFLAMDGGELGIFTAFPKSNKPLTKDCLNPDLIELQQTKNLSNRTFDVVIKRLCTVYGLCLAFCLDKGKDQYDVMRLQMIWSMIKDYLKGTEFHKQVESVVTDKKYSFCEMKDREASVLQIKENCKVLLKDKFVSEFKSLHINFYQEFAGWDRNKNTDYLLDWIIDSEDHPKKHIKQYIHYLNNKNEENIVPLGMMSLMSLDDMDCLNCKAEQYYKKGKEEAALTIYEIVYKNCYCNLDALISIHDQVTDDSDDGSTSFEYYINFADALNNILNIYFDNNKVENAKKVFRKILVYKELYNQPAEFLEKKKLNNITFQQIEKRIKYINHIWDGVDEPFSKVDYWPVYEQAGFDMKLFYRYCAIKNCYDNKKYLEMAKDTNRFFEKIAQDIKLSGEDSKILEGIHNQGFYQKASEYMGKLFKWTEKEKIKKFFENEQYKDAMEEVRKLCMEFYPRACLSKI